MAASERERSVNDYKTREAVKQALAEFEPSTESSETEISTDWELTNYDAETSISNVNDIDGEANRLMALQSYNILDTEVHPAFEEVTMAAKEMFNTPIAVVSLVDLGRQWFKSIQGLEAKSTPRCVAFCAHVVKRKEEHGVMVVPDATKDDRFKNNPFVAGPVAIRFYAGAQLRSPEGEVLGTLCVIDMKPRPPLTQSEEMRLMDLASCAVYNIIMEA